MENKQEPIIVVVKQSNKMGLVSKIVLLGNVIMLSIAACKGINKIAKAAVKAINNAEVKIEQLDS